MTSRATLTPLLIGAWTLLSAVRADAATESAQPTAAEMYLAVADAAAAPAAAAQKPGEPAEAVDEPAEPLYPTTPMQTAGALVGALVGILLAIAGVTVTFRSMRKEMRRGRGRSRRSERGTLPQI